MDRKRFKITLEVMDNVPVKYQETAQYIKENLKTVYEREKMPTEKIFYFLVFCFR